MATKTASAATTPKKKKRRVGSPKPGTVPRVLTFTVDMKALSSAQNSLLDRHAGTARMAWNWALGLRNDYEDSVRAQARALLAAHLGTDDPDKLTAAFDTSALNKDNASPAQKAQAKKNAALRRQIYAQARKDIFTRTGQKSSDFSALALSSRQTRLARAGEEPWHWWLTEKHGVSRHAMTSALRNLDQAFDRYFQIRMGKIKPPPLKRNRKPRKDGRPDHYPRFKALHRTTPAFALFNLPKTEKNLLPQGRRIKLPNLGRIRVQEDLSALRRLVRAGGVPTSARLRKDGDRWQIALSLTFDQRHPFVQPRQQTKRQRAGGDVAISLGIKHAASLSDGTRIPNPRVLESRLQQIQHLKRLNSRQQGPRKKTKTRDKQTPSQAWLQTRDRIRTIERRTRLERQRLTHTMTKRLVTEHHAVAVKDIAVDEMTLRPEAQPNDTGGFDPNGAKRQTDLNRGVLDIAFGEIKRQLEYKSEWYGCDLTVLENQFPSAKTCFECGHVKDVFPLEIRTFVCEECGYTCERALNAARNVHRRAGLTSQIG